MDGGGDIDASWPESTTKNQPSQGRIFAYERTGRKAVSAGSTQATEHLTAQLVDIDNDGDLDVISISWTHNRVMVCEQGRLPD